MYIYIYTYKKWTHVHVQICILYIETCTYTICTWRVHKCDSHQKCNRVACVSSWSWHTSACFGTRIQRCWCLQRGRRPLACRMPDQVMPFCGKQMWFSSPGVLIIWASELHPEVRMYTCPTDIPTALDSLATLHLSIMSRTSLNSLQKKRSLKTKQHNWEFQIVAIYIYLLGLIWTWTKVR